MATWLWLQATLVGVAVAAGSVFLVRHGPSSSLWIFLFGVPTLLLSALLAFDAYLFGLIARQSDEQRGCRSVDIFLADAGLKRMPSGTRNLSSRVAGTRRLIYSQGIFAGLFAWGFLSWVQQT